MFIFAFILTLLFSIILISLVLKYNVLIRLKIIIIVVTIFLITAGLFMIYNSTADFACYQEMKKWTAVKGIVVDGRVVGERAKRPEVIYSYKVGTALYEGRSDFGMPSFGGKNYRDQSSRAVVKEFKKGDSVCVYYNPKKNKQSVLKISPKWSSFLQYGLGVIFLPLAFGLLFSGFLKRK